MSSPLGLVFGLESSVGAKSYEIFEPGDKGVGSKTKSLFDGSSVFTPFPELQIDEKTGVPIGPKKFTDVHNDSIYDTTTSSIIKWSQNKASMRLGFMDFAYLKNLGVYPNNRLIVARRFGSAVGNDLHRIRKMAPNKTLVSWIPEDEEFLKVSYNEVWKEAEASFVDVLNDIGKSTKLSGDDKNPVGSFLARGLDMIPFPGLMEPIQRKIMAKFGLAEDTYALPIGDPNLIREAKRRSTVEPDQPGSGLACDIQIKMEVEYEQKFINGVDPTLAYLDILHNAIYFGTSNAIFQMGSGFAGGAKGLLGAFLSGSFERIGKALEEIVKTVFDTISDLAADLAKALANPPKDDKPPGVAIFENAIRKAFVSVGKAFSAVIGKYKQRLLGIINALTGSPSTPWHITIGNPKKPIFSSGDMLLTKVDMEMGKILAYNDLPSTVKFTLTFENARSLGASEIYNRLNTGRGRSVTHAKIEKSSDKNNNGTSNSAGGPQNDKITTTDFNASPIGGENGSFSNVAYATTAAKGTPWPDLLFVQDPSAASPNNSGQISTVPERTPSPFPALLFTSNPPTTAAANTTPVNVAEANVAADGKLANAGDPSGAGSGNIDSTSLNSLANAQTPAKDPVVEAQKPKERKVGSPAKVSASKAGAATKRNESAKKLTKKEIDDKTDALAAKKVALRIEIDTYVRNPPQRVLYGLQSQYNDALAAHNAKISAKNKELANTQKEFDKYQAMR